MCKKTGKNEVVEEEQVMRAAAIWKGLVQFQNLF